MARRQQVDCEHQSALKCYPTAGSQENPGDLYIKLIVVSELMKSNKLQDIQLIPHKLSCSATQTTPVLFESQMSIHGNALTRRTVCLLTLLFCPLRKNTDDEPHNRKGIFSANQGGQEQVTIQNPPSTSPLWSTNTKTPALLTGVRHHPFFQSFCYFPVHIHLYIPQPHKYFKQCFNVSMFKQRFDCADSKKKKKSRFKILSTWKCLIFQKKLKFPVLLVSEIWIRFSEVFCYMIFCWLL